MQPPFRGKRVFAKKSTYGIRGMIIRQGCDDGLTKKKAGWPGHGVGRSQRFCLWFIFGEVFWFSGRLFVSLISLRSFFSSLSLVYPSAQESVGSTKSLFFWFLEQPFILFGVVVEIDRKTLAPF